MDNKFVRGGNWSSTSNNLSSSLRGGGRPALGGNTLGFRVVKEVEPRVRSLRGGGWFINFDSLSSSCRIVFPPPVVSSYGGFRVVKEATNGQ